MIVMKNETASTANARQRWTWGIDCVVIASFLALAQVIVSELGRPPVQVLIRGKAAIHRPLESRSPDATAYPCAISFGAITLAVQACLALVRRGLVNGAAAEPAPERTCAASDWHGNTGWAHKAFRTPSSGRVPHTWARRASGPWSLARHSPYRSSCSGLRDVLR